MAWREYDLRQIYDLIINSLSDAANFKPLIIRGKSGVGKSEVLGLIYNKAKELGITASFAKCLPVPEARQFDQTVQLIEQAFGITIREIDEESILEKFRKNIKRTHPVLFLLEKMNNMTNPSLGLLMKLITEKSSFPSVLFLGSLDVNSSSDEMISKVLETTDRFDFIQVKKTSQGDVDFLLRSWGYRLPAEINEALYTMTDGKVDLLRYCLLYYELNGFINAEKSVNESMLRYLPMPPPLDSFYDVQMASLSDTDRDVLYLALVMHGNLKSAEIADLLEIDGNSAMKSLKKLVQEQMVIREGEFIAIANNQLRDFLKAAKFAVDIENISRRIVKAKSFERLPVSVRMTLLNRSEDPDSIVNFLAENGDDILRGFNSYDVLLDELNKSLALTGKKGERVITPILCSAYYYSGRIPESINCMERYMKKFKPANSHMLIYGLSLLSVGREEDALRAVEELENNGSLTEEENIKAKMLRGNVMLSRRENAEAEKVFEATLQLSEKLGNKELMANSINSLGVVALNRFDLDRAEKYFYRALQIAEEVRYNDLKLRVSNNLAVLNDYRGRYDHAIEFYREVIDQSIFTGNLRARSIATFNLMELYEIVGDLWSSRNYLDIEEKLIDIVRDETLSYLFYRSAAKSFLQDLRLDYALKYAIAAKEIAERIGLGQWNDIAKGLIIIIDGLQNDRYDEAAPNYILKEFNEPEDFLPYYYAFGGFYFEHFGMVDYRNRTTKLIEDFGMKSNEYFSRSVIPVVRSITMASEGRLMDAIDMLMSASKHSSGIAVINFLEDIFKIINQTMNGEISDPHVFFVRTRKDYSEKVPSIFIGISLFIEIVLRKLEDPSAQITYLIDEMEKIAIPAATKRYLRNRFGVRL